MLDDKNQVLMNFYVNTTMPDISIKEIKLANSDKLFYEVICTAGAHAKLEGYWLVAQQDRNCECLSLRKETLLKGIYDD